MDARTLGASFGAVALLTIAGCGGSSSETPPPLEPDPEGFRYAGTKPVRPKDETAAEPPEADEEDDAETRPSKAARSKQAPSTWGRPEPTPAEKQPELK